MHTRIARAGHSTRSRWNLAARYQESLEPRSEVAFARKKPWKNGKTKKDGGGENMHSAL